MFVKKRLPSFQRCLGKHCKVFPSCKRAMGIQCSDRCHVYKVFWPATCKTWMIMQVLNKMSGKNEPQKLFPKTWFVKKNIYNLIDSGWDIDGIFSVYTVWADISTGNVISLWDPEYYGLWADEPTFAYAPYFCRDMSTPSGVCRIPCYQSATGCWMIKLDRSWPKTGWFDCFCFRPTGCVPSLCTPLDMPVTPPWFWRDIVRDCVWASMGRPFFFLKVFAPLKIPGSTFSFISATNLRSWKTF